MNSKARSHDRAFSLVRSICSRDGATAIPPREGRVAPKAPGGEWPAIHVRPLPHPSSLGYRLRHSPARCAGRRSKNADAAGIRYAPSPNGEGCPLQFRQLI